MSYAGSEAVSLAYAERSQAYERAALRPAFEVVNGAGLDARVRQGVSDDFITKVRIALVAVVTVVVLGACRIGICAMTLTTLQSNSALRAEIKQAQALETDLKVTSSLLSDSSRIDRIATQNYGMVKVTDYETISIPLVDAPQVDAQAEAEAADPADAAIVQAEADEEEQPLVTTMAMPKAEETEDEAEDEPGIFDWAEAVHRPDGQYAHA
ncbi:MAG: hypothetical protein IJI16_07505 [Atopobiaceae bacterium]|nr:hypothetical protein [Atopobiaceae bacterium]MBQ3283838.1 hypothetical protein [Atopobiaceae bacterium]MBQ6411779.1 hypothetical protein [Atopobiaceae bacterium]MBQ6650560.1 hypothetical protein [Atopobiaceae bacterium]MBR3384345.1 hypothetical protein [Atopobiaceae bacterium]